MATLAEPKSEMTPEELSKRENEFNTGPRSILTPSAETNTPQVSYGRRVKSGDVVFNYNCDESLKWNICRGETKWNIQVVSDTIKSNSKYMFQKSRDMALTMDQVTTSIGSVIVQDSNLENEQSLKESCAEDVVYVGRIRSDGKLTADSVYLEGTLGISEGHIAALDLSLLEEYFVFPGQVVAVTGKNSLGRCITVNRISIPKPLPLVDKSIDICKEIGIVSFIVVSGPFTTSESLEFEPIIDLVSIIKSCRPNICIVIGPFIDASHPMLDSYKLEDTFKALIEKQIQLLSGAALEAACQLILVASHKDVHHHLVYPTPPYNISSQILNCTCVSDPAVVSVGGIRVGLTSSDVLMHLSKTELASTTISADRMGRLSRHVLSQRNFYPVYAPDESLPLDIEQWAEFAQMTSSPHILVLPSELRYFIKDVNGTLVVNPQHVTKGQSGGFYCKLQVEITESENKDSFSISDFVVGQIIKI